MNNWKRFGGIFVALWFLIPITHSLGLMAWDHTYYLGLTNAELLHTFHVLFIRYLFHEWFTALILTVMYWLFTGGGGRD